MFSRTRFFRVFAIMLSMAGAASAAHADCIPISSVPYTISQSGSYCVTADLAVALSDNQQAITVLASDVDIDFQGHLIQNTATASTWTAGVQLRSWMSANNVVNNVTVHNGLLYFFEIGVDSRNSSASMTSNVTVDHMTIMYSRVTGIQLQAANPRVTNNTVNFVMGSTSVTGIWVADNSVKNMTASNRAVVQGNGVGGIRSSGKMPDGTVAQMASAVGIAVGGFPDILIRDNAVYGVFMPNLTPDWSPTTYARASGISISQLVEPYRVAGLIVQDNTVVNNVLYIKNAKTNSVGIVINNPGDHAIVTGSNITGMNTGLETGYVVLPGTPPVLFLNNTITGATTPINVGPTNGGVTLPQ
jgi:hypothetical protein